MCARLAGKFCTRFSMSRTHRNFCSPPLSRSVLHQNLEFQKKGGKQPHGDTFYEWRDENHFFPEVPDMSSVERIKYITV